MISTRVAAGPREGFVGRRAFLRSGFACAAAMTAAAAASGCGRLAQGAAPKPASTRTTLTVAAHHLVPVAGPLTTAWASAHRTSSLVVVSDVGPPPRYESPTPDYWKADVAEATGDGMLWNGPSSFVNLSPLLHQANFDLGRLIRSGVQAFSIGGDLFGLPLVSNPFVTMVNTALLQHLGITHPAGQPWTLAQMRAAVATARASSAVPSSAQIINGYPWTDIRLWGAFVLGLGGTLTGPDGALAFDSRACLDATAALIDLATAANWPGRQGGPSGSRLVYHNFSGASAQTLFAIEPDFPNPDGSVGVTGPENRFPLMPSNPLIPAYQTYGLSVPARATNPLLALEFILWLYAPSQQQLLLSSGIPPVVTDQPALHVQWSQETPGGQNVASLSDPGRMVDVLGLLPQDGYVLSRDYNASLQPALLDAAQHPANAAPDLLKAQQQIAQRIAQSSAHTLCVLTHPQGKDCPPTGGASKPTG